MYVTIDPGEQTGWSIWTARHELVACGLGDPRSSTKHVAADIDAVWIESQVIYERSKVRPRDIIKLAQSAGTWAGVYATLAADVHWVEPSTWKGQLPKPVHHRLVRGALTGQETATLAIGTRGLAAYKAHNVLDAVGIGLWVARRVGR